MPGWPTIRCRPWQQVEACPQRISFVIGFLAFAPEAVIVHAQAGEVVQGGRALFVVEFDVVLLFVLGCADGQPRAVTRPPVPCRAEGGLQPGGDVVGAGVHLPVGQRGAVGGFRSPHDAPCPPGISSLEPVLLRAQVASHAVAHDVGIKQVVVRGLVPFQVGVCAVAVTGLSPQAALRAVGERLHVHRGQAVAVALLHHGGSAFAVQVGTGFHLGERTGVPPPLHGRVGIGQVVETRPQGAVFVHPFQHGYAVAPVGMEGQCGSEAAGQEYVRKQFHK